MSKKALLNEEVTRRMMKLANIGAINTQNFITEAYDELEEASAQPVNEEEELEEGWGSKEDEYKRHDVGGVEKKTGDVKGHYKDYEMKEGEHEEEELHATEDELGAEDELADEEGAELDALEGGDMEADLAADEEAAMDVEGGGKEEKFKEIVDLLADLLDVEADVELDGDDGVEAEEEIAVDTPEGDLDIEMGEEDLMEALTARVTERITKMQETKEKAQAQKEQIAESVADRIMKRLES